MPEPGPGRPRSTSNTVATKPACAPLKAMYARAVASKPKAWQPIEGEFLRAMETFDHNVATGVADQGDRQNGKGDFFNDLLALLLEGCAGVTLYSRGGVPGFVFPNHNLDVTYPNTGVVKFTLEAKAVGTPKHPGNTRQRNPLGRDGAADLDKRVKEGAFKVIDLKAEYGRIMTTLGQTPGVGAGGDLTTFLRSQNPHAYLFIAARVTSPHDCDRVIRHAEVAGQVFDGVGIFCFQPISAAQPTSYVAVPDDSVPASFQLERVLYRACQNLQSLEAEGPTLLPSDAPLGPAAQLADDTAQSDDSES
jgi:hypothetical protein